MIAGVLLCFIPIVGEFVIPDLLGGSDSMMIGQTLWTEFFANRDWPVASAVAIVLLCLLLVPIVIYQHLQMRELERGVESCARPFGLQRHLGRARPGVPLSADRDPGDLFVQRLAAGHASGAAGRRAGMPRCCNDEGMLDAAWITLRIGARVGDRRDRAGHARRDRAGAGRAVSRPHAVFGRWSMRRWSCPR